MLSKAIVKLVVYTLFFFFFFFQLFGLIKSLEEKKKKLIQLKQKILISFEVNYAWRIKTVHAVPLRCNQKRNKIRC